MNEPAAPAEGFDRALRREQDPEFFDRQEEEARAARHSLPTRLLAWSMIAYQLLLLIAILFGKGGMGIAGRRLPGSGVASGSRW